jgi:hypothetical protein
MFILVRKFLLLALSLLTGFAGTGLSTSAEGAQIDLVQKFDEYLATSFTSPVLTRQAAEDLAQFFMTRTRYGAREAGLNAVRDLKENLNVYLAQHPNDQALGFKLRSLSEALLSHIEKMKNRRGWQGAGLTVTAVAGAIYYLNSVVLGDPSEPVIMILVFGVFAGFLPTLKVVASREEVSEAVSELNKPYAQCAFLMAEGL